MQDQRADDDQGCKLAESDDYRVARELLERPMQAAFGDKQLKRVHDVLRKKLGAEKAFDRKAADEAMGFGNITSSINLLKAMEHRGAIKQVTTGKKNSSSIYEWVGEGKLNDVLPSVAAVDKYLNS